tara:strand:- start:21555 stop:23363 length:1809 start_codon:yes stop_codon:yes gene_type:complete
MSLGNGLTESFIVGKIKYFVYFYKYLSYRIFVSVLLNIFVGVLDGFGLAMFLPLLQMINEENDLAPSELGPLQFLPDMISSMGVPFNLTVVLFFLCTFFGLKGLFKFWSEAYNVKTQQYYVRKLRLGLIDDMNQLAYKSFIQTDIGRIQNTMTGEVGRVVSAYHSYFAVIQQIVMVLVYMSFALYVNAQFAVLVIIGALITNILYRSVYKRTREASYEVTNLSHVLESYLIQFTQNFKYLKATALIRTFSERIRKTTLDVEVQNKKIGILSAVLMALKEPILVVVVSLVILIESMFFKEPLGPILISLLFFYRSLGALMAMQNEWNKFIARIGSLSNMIDFQSYLLKNTESYGKGIFERLKHEIEIIGLSFSYGDVRVLKDVSLTIKRNETIAFVGESGSGKTTLVNVIAGLMPIDSGSFKIDGNDTSALDLRTFQTRVGYITQEPVIFNDTIFNNITFWAEPNDSNKAKFEDSIKKASISSYIADLEQGSDTLLGSNGVNVSGGQKQRISIARELFKEVDLLILDEATSALDSETEKDIQNNIDMLKGQITILVVAHRLSTIRNADRVVLMSRGEIDKIGDFETLKSNSPMFKRMVELQEF